MCSYVCMYVCMYSAHVILTLLQVHILVTLLVHNIPLYMYEEEMKFLYREGIS